MPTLAPIELTGEKDLAERIGRGDSQAFDALYQRHWESLFHYVVKVLRDEDQACDVLQDVFSTLWTQREKLPAIQSIKSYLFVSARHAALRVIAHQKSRQRFMDSLAGFLQDDQMTTTVEEDYTFQELQQKLDERINKLPARMRSVFLLSRVENLSHREIAKRMGLAESTVKKQINYALKFIRTKLHYPPLAFFLLYYFL